MSKTFILSLTHIVLNAVSIRLIAATMFSLVPHQHIPAKMFEFTVCAFFRYEKK